MQLSLELLAPARNADIGIAAIDCGADAVYIAGPSFGARAAAGNPVDEIARLCRYAHRYGARIHSTVNTLLQVDEREQARKLMWELYEAGVDVFLVQDLNLLALDLPPVELHASTQTAIRTPERAKALAGLGFSRLVLERQLTLDQVRAIRAAVPDTCLLEFFIHGALCVGYSGQCYLSQFLTGRSANRGACAQPCRSRYDLVDADGKVLVHDHTLLSPKDLRFDRLLPDLVAAGIRSFKIEGRLKNAAYVKNVVRYYRDVIDRFIKENPAYCKASSGRLEGGFTPDPGKTFTRGWTEAFLQGRQERLASEDAAKALGEPIGEILSVKGRDVVLKTDKMLVNGDGLSFVGRSDDVTGARAEVVQGNRVTLRDTAGLLPGMRVYRNLDVRFEKELEKDMPVRIIDVAVSWHSQEGRTTVIARTEDGFSVEKVFPDDAPAAEKPEAARESIRRQLDKRTGPFAFHVEDLAVDVVRFYPAATLNGIRRELAAALQEKLETRPRHEVPHTPQPDAAALNRSTLDLPEELLRSRYCIKWELGLCTRFPAKPGMTEGVRTGKLREPLYLVNQKNKLRLAFDCARCEMTVLLAADR
jgi:putative protease